MKKLFLFLFVALVSATAAMAMKPNMQFGVDYDYSSKGGNSGFGFQLEYQFLDNLRISPEFIYSCENGDAGHFTNVNINLQYVIDSHVGFNVYPMAGFAYVNSKGDINKCGANVGCGVEFNIGRNFAIYTEETFQMVDHATRFITGVGLKYAF